ncbi:formate dehydrogenase subunit alpha [Amycolatopsis deserti]|uniref:Formate dehydrogenase subunit alpha n=1 Tax=Amycolatopsis deserti TaxID=185696 RepID=A0ABQ3IFM4_9PSEU|nr:FdhF/YdeP family oxidoreductase [Amycolatopsis deserti]GHE80460.1 formate dehydrogenase subunit alpha [Amycolatopsis deserti]
MRGPDGEIDEAELRVGEVHDHAAGMTAVGVSLKRAYEQMGVARTVMTLPLLNQRHGFDCPGCAWPESQGRRKPAEFCENGAKAVAEEATTRRVTREFFAAHPIAELATKTDYWLGQQGRLTEPMVLRPGGTHYEPISWEAAFALMAGELNAMTSPDEALFYTSGRTSNEAAFLYQLFGRSLGTNNLPDCSNMCHESSGAALTETIGIGKGSVSLADLHGADLILVVGQNPGTNHPRMLSALEEAKRGGASIISVNPLPEAGLMRFKDPQGVRGVLGGGTALTDVFCQIRLGGDLAFFKAIAARLFALEEQAPGTVLDREFLDRHTHGFDPYRVQARDVDEKELLAATGLTSELLDEVAVRFARAERIVLCWAMGLTQHKHSVPTIRKAVNLLLLRGMIGKPGAGVCPVRGHSNVQGDRTMGICEKMPESFLAALDAEFGITSPRKHGYDTVDGIRAMARGEIRVFMGMGGNFARATPDTQVTEAALRRCLLTVQVSTKLNRSHLATGDTALILPTLGRTERDPSGFVTVEDSMSVVHRSRGRLRPASGHLLSEPVIVCRLARATLGAGHPGPWEEFETGYDRVREAIARVVPGCEDYNTRVRGRNGFVLPHPPRDSREFPTTTGKAHLTVNELTYPRVPEGRLLLQTLRSHDQYNTTIYGLSDRYRGIENARRVVMVHPGDLGQLGLRDGQTVDLVSEWTDGTERRVTAFRVVAYPTARGCAAAYYPETNPLVPLDSVADTSNTPASKSVVVRLEPAAGPFRENP